METKPAAESKTLKFNRLATLWTGIVMAAPSVLGFVIELLGDPTISAAVQNAIPLKYRALVFAIVFFVSKRNMTLRKQTTSAIEGTPAADSANVWPDVTTLGKGPWSAEEREELNKFIAEDEGDAGSAGKE